MASHPITIEAAGGEYMESVLVVEWVVKPGDRVRAGQHLLTVETAKAATEVEADRDGWIETLLVPAGEEAPVGAPLGLISDTEPAATEAAPAIGAVPGAGAGAAPAPALAAEASVAAGLSPASPPVAAAPSPAPHGGRIIASPLARRLARAAGLSLSALTGTGPHGRIKRRDVEAHLAAPRPAPAPVASPAAAGSTPLVLLHGFGADRNGFSALRAALPPEIATIALDLPGHGREGARRALTPEALADDIAGRLLDQGHEVIHLAGHSLGGAVALALLGGGRITVRSLTLLAPGGLGLEVNAAFIGGLTEAPTPEALEPLLRLMVADPAALPPGLAGAMLRQIERENLREAQQQMAARLFPGGVQAFDLREALARATCPLRVIWGREDRVIPAAHASALPGHVALHLLPGIGHVPQMECPELAARLLAQTVRSAG